MLKRTTTLAAAVLVAPLLLSPAEAEAEAETDAARNATRLAGKLVRTSSADDAYTHLKKFQQLADAAGGHRAAGSPGHDASAAYIYQQLKKYGYDVSYDRFDFIYTETRAERLKVLSPAPRDVAITAMTYTKSTPVGGIKAGLAAVPVDDTTGCQPADYASGAFTGKIALIKRGGCTFGEKQTAAAGAGAAGAIIYNDADGVLTGTLGDPAAGRIPTGGVTKAEGEKLAAALARRPARPVNLSLELRQLQEKRSTNNVIAETRGGNAARTVMLGAHLDSVTAGPGINDNGSGSAGLLEVAQELAESRAKPANKVRFAWWSAEENGLFGSKAYVANLSSAARKEIKLYLNFDMIASPNPGLFVYDGDDSDSTGAGPGPAGSAQLERDISAFLDRRGKQHEGTDLTGRSDYGPFIAAGIPSGGTFTGAEGVKTAAQARKFGGTAGVAYDSCYHAACDTLGNIDMSVFAANIGVIANAVGTYAHDLNSLRQP
ncbi:M28 family metallopeptidase [Streptomyces sp. NPDC052236]|uniref:M28 family metallopeptidase n=1 Tax=Streptomyces sp. NPDC052236 TaxID=3365686 RepID=UPI0037CDA8CD